MNKSIILYHAVAGTLQLEYCYSQAEAKTLLKL